MPHKARDLALGCNLCEVQDSPLEPHTCLPAPPSQGRTDTLCNTAVISIMLYFLPNAIIHINIKHVYVYLCLHIHNINWLKKRTFGPGGQDYHDTEKYIYTRERSVAPLPCIPNLMKIYMYWSTRPLVVAQWNAVVNHPIQWYS